MKKTLAYLGSIGEIIISVGVFIAFLATFPYLVTGLYPHMFQIHGLNYFLLDWSVAVLFLGTLTLCFLSFGRAIGRLAKLLKSESDRTKYLLVIIIFPILWIGMTTSLLIFGHSFWRIPGILFISVWFIAIILNSIQDYKKAKTKKGKESN
jgi:hypothetical protein